MASSSSMNTTHGAFFRASAKSSRTRAAPRPTRLGPYEGAKEADEIGSLTELEVEGELDGKMPHLVLAPAAAGAENVPPQEGESMFGLRGEGTGQAAAEEALDGWRRISPTADNDVAAAVWGAGVDGARLRRGVEEGRVRRCWGVFFKQKTAYEIDM